MVKEHNLNSSENSKQTTKRVHGKFLLEFDLKKILSNISELQSIKNEAERLSLIRKSTHKKAGMSAIDAKMEKSKPSGSETTP